MFNMTQIAIINLDFTYTMYLNPIKNAFKMSEIDRHMSEIERWCPKLTDITMST